MYILCGLKGQCLILNHDQVDNVYEYMGAECSKLRQPMREIFVLSRAQLLLLVVTRSRDLSRECHVTNHKTPARSNFPLSNFESSGTIQFSSSSSTSRGLCPNNFEKRCTLLSSVRPETRFRFRPTRHFFKSGFGSGQILAGFYFNF